LQKPNFSMNYLIQIGLVHLMVVSGIAAPEQVPPGNPVTLTSQSLDIAFNVGGGPDQALARPGDEAVKFRSDLTVFSVMVRDAQGKESAIPLSDLSLNGKDRLIARSKDHSRQVVFKISRGTRHIGLRIAAVSGLATDREGVRVAFYDTVGKRRFRAIDLDWMADIGGGHNWIEFRWDHLDHPVAPGNLGGLAFYTAADDADEDEALLNIWVDEQMAHPRVAGAWTLERAREWVMNWQRVFADRSQMILEGKSLDELRAGIPYAERMKAKEIYLFTQTWRTDNFWPAQNGHVDINRAVFPRGEEDLRAFSDELATKGMQLKIHYVSGGIGKSDSHRIGTKPDRRLASWAKAAVAKPVAPDDAAIALTPSSRVTWTGGKGSNLGRPNGLPAFFEFHVVRLDDELIEVGAFENSDSGDWLLTGCRRGAFGTIKAAHARGGVAAALVVPYNQNFVPDNDSPLLEEMAKEYAGMLERCRIAHTEYDGAEIHCYNGNWGYRKFATLVYQNLPQPVTAHDSSGGAPRAYFEYRFNSSRRLMRGLCPFTHSGWNAPVQLDSQSRKASSMLDAQFFLSQGHYGGGLGLCRPEPMFSVSADSLKTFGLTDRMIQAILDWKAVSRLLTEDQHSQLQASFQRTSEGMPGRNHHLQSPVVHEARKTATGYNLVPVRVLTRAKGDIPWQLGQEHGPIGPRQFLKTGDRIELVNPERPQIPGFLIRVLWGFAQQGPTVTATASNATTPPPPPADSQFTAGNDAARTKAQVAKPNLRMMPNDKQNVRNQGSSTVTREGDLLRVVAAPAGEKAVWENSELPSWGSELDMSGRRGVGLEVNGDGSGATLLIQVRGHGMRDYAVPIDFTGRRWIEIPNGEVAWAQGCWGWRMETKSCNYEKIGAVHLGFGFVPPRSKPSVTVARLQALAEIPVTLTNPVLTLGTRRVTMMGTVSSGEYLEYQGGDTASVCDANWNPLRTMSVSGAGEIPTGNLTVALDAASTGPKPWLEIQITTQGEPMVVTGP
jgi:hypothetical protein